jgi:AraC-like DNA-binding protein
LTYDLVTATFREITEITPECEDEVADSVLNAVYLPFLQKRLVVPPSEILKRRAKSYIWRNIRDSDLCIDRIAAALNCTKRYLHMVFDSEHTTITKYIWMVRLERCRRELETCSDLEATVTDIAFSWGFQQFIAFQPDVQRHIWHATLAPVAPGFAMKPPRFRM